MNMSIASALEPDSPLGVSQLAADRWCFRVWAPRCQTVQLVLPETQQRIEMTRELHAGSDRSVTLPRRGSQGVFTAVVEGLPAGTLYGFCLDGGPVRPDPRSQFQPHGVHSESQLIDHSSFDWTDAHWQGVARRDLVIYEMHVGCFSQSGDYAGVVAALPRLKDLGITAIELLPLAETPGRWNWGYDGVHLYAPKAAYGHPDELKHLINACHRAGLAVLLDVVYNHLGPEGNYLSEFGPYFTNRYRTPWGPALHFEGRRGQQVRRWLLDNLRYWLDIYHFDGLRLDAIHYLYDKSEPSIIDEIATTFHEIQEQNDRHLHLFAESNVFDPTLVLETDWLEPPQRPTRGYTGQWADCWLHSLYSLGTDGVRLTNRPYHGAQDAALAREEGYVYQGQSPGEYSRSSESAVEPNQPHAGLVVAMQTHDAVGNHPQGHRIHHLTDIEFARAAAGLTLLAPTIPLLFMGEEGAVPSPFCFFTDFGDPGLQAAVDRGRQREYPHHEWVGAVPPSDPQAFHSSRLPPCEVWDMETHRWYQAVLKLRKEGLQRGWLQPSHAVWEAAPEEHYFRVDYPYRDQCYTVEGWLVPARSARQLGQAPSTGGAAPDHRSVRPPGIAGSPSSAPSTRRYLLDSWDFGGPSSQSAPPGTYRGGIDREQDARSRCLISVLECPAESAGELLTPG